MSMTREEVVSAVGFYAGSDLPRERSLAKAICDVDERVRNAKPVEVALSPEVEAAIDRVVEQRVSAAIAAAKAAKAGPKAREDLAGDSAR